MHRDALAAHDAFIQGLPQGGELDTSAPHGADGQRVADVGRWVAVD